MVGRTAREGAKGSRGRGHLGAENRRRLRHARVGPHSRRVDHVQRRLQGHAAAPASSARAVPRRLTVPTMTMVQAIRSALDVMLERDSDVVVFGEDVERSEEHTSELQSPYVISYA